MGELPDGTMKVHLHAPREKGKANAALQKLLAEVFGTRADAIEIIAGHAAELKFIRVAGANK